MLLGPPHDDDLEGAPAHAPGADVAPGGELPFDAPFRDFQHAAEREYLRRTLLRHGGQVAEAAESSGINRTYFYRLLKKYAL